MNLNNIFTNFIKKENLSNQKILLMVSGGVDSRVLLEVSSCNIDKKNLAVFHLNHCPGDTEKISHYEFVKNLCEKKGIKFYGENLEKIPNKDKENYWRKQRKKFSQKYAKNFGAKKILTAHHATDLVETMIFRLTKGSGIKGLCPFDISTKPFWQVPKTELEDYEKKNNLEFKKDFSNDLDIFERNLIRKNVLPYLRKITPNLEKIFVKEFQIFEETYLFLEQEIEKINIKKKSIPIDIFQKLSPIIQKELLRKIVKKIPSYSETEDFFKWIKNTPKGNSQKNLGETKFFVKQNFLVWS